MKLPVEFEIKIISHMQYSEYKYDIAYGRAKRFLSKKHDKKTLKFNDFALLINKCAGGVIVRILPLSDDMSKDKKPKFYKDFYNTNRVSLLQYNSLRQNFNKMVTDVLGKDYYNMAMDVYDADRICCEDITSKSATFWQRILNKFKAN